MSRVPVDVRTAQRSLVATLEITGLAAGAHVLAGGHLPGPGFLLAFGAVVLGAAFLTIGRVLPVGLVVGFVLVAQVGLHLSFEAAHPTHADAAASAATTFGLTPMMFWAHAVTAVLTAIVLLLQERVLAAVVAWWSALDLSPAVPGRPGRRTSYARVVRTDRQQFLRTSPRRGPPVASAATP